MHIEKYFYDVQIYGVPIEKFNFAKSINGLTPFTLDVYGDKFRWDYVLSSQKPVHFCM